MTTIIPAQPTRGLWQHNFAVEGDLIGLHVGDRPTSQAVPRIERARDGRLFFRSRYLPAGKEPDTRLSRDVEASRGR